MNRRRIVRRPTYLLWALLIALAAAWVTRADAQIFSTGPMWTLPYGASQGGMTLGDVDGDGDLDLTAGGDQAMLFGNESNGFDLRWWSAAIPLLVRDVVLSDINGDGFLDLVCAGRTGSSGQYRRVVSAFMNTGEYLAPSPGWEQELETTCPTCAFEIELGDVDNDGDPDLVVGGQDHSGLSTLPAWSGQANPTIGVALGDVDGDGDLDLVCGSLGERSTLYLNEGGVFATLPAWSSSQVNNTVGVALGDVDGDGDIDLVSGNDSQSSTLYLNEGGVFAALPAWSSTQANATYSVALGDVDGDGDLDLICGNYGQGSMLYLNEGGLFAPLPAWSGPASSTLGVALGDVDGDGDLDLVCGNDSQSSTLYLNEAGLFATLPAWSSGQSSTTWAVALGDVDGDGDLDLVCGNLGQSSTLYLNEGGLFAALPAWSGQSSGTGVALGDVDGDGDLDLVCGNDSQSSTLYLNEQGLFATLPAWSSGQTHATYDVALGDVDGDGDLDLVCADIDRSATLYLNEVFRSPSKLYVNDGGTLANSPAWESTGPTNGVVLADIDGDGLLDLLCGTGDNESPQRKALYRNIAGTFTSDPVWISEDSTRTHAMAAGDIDGDGDFDLVCGNYSGPGRGYPNTMYLNEGGTLSNVPVWYSADSLYTTAIALGDVDGDADLDLACANADADSFVTVYLNFYGVLSRTPDGLVLPGISSASAVAFGDVDGDGDLDLIAGSSNSIEAFRNETPVLDNIPGWQSQANEYATSVATGDINHDGAHDLAFGNYGTPNALFYNRDGTFPVIPDWRSQDVSQTHDIALADVYGDGFDDVIAGNYLRELRVYSNQSGVVVRQSSWQGPAYATRAIALGDADDDGRVDLAVASENGGALHLNTGNGFATNPAWTGTETGGSAVWTDVAFGDMDNDGNLDLVFGKTYEREVYYKNQGGTFPLLPTWQSVSFDYTNAISLGDINHDSFIDLACAGYPASTLYRNSDGGILETVPSWASTDVQPASDMALSDMDGDGDLDLVGARGYTQATIHLNNNGALSSNPVWTSAGTGLQFNDVAVADFDVDGDMDCAFASYPRNAIFYGRAQPPFKNNPLQPTNHLANNDAYIRSVRLTSVPGFNVMPISFTAIDVESDSIMVTGEYQFKGTPDWHPMEFVSYGRRGGPFATSPEGIQVDDLAWDIATIPFSEKDAILRLRVSSPRPRVALVQRVPSFLIDAGHVVPARAGVHASLDAVEFPSVTVGDTVSIVLRIENIGNRRLTVQDTAIPEAVSMDPPPPYSLRPREVIDVVYSFHPDNDRFFQECSRFQTNDPLGPLLELCTPSSTIHPLSGTTRAVTTTPVVPLGDALSIILRPSEDTHVERCKIFFRSLGDTAFATSEMAPFFESFTGIIPSWGVTESGVEYYVQMENSGVFDTDPPGAPDSLFFQAVGTPGTIATTPIPTSESDFLEGRSISVRLNLPEGAIFESGTIYYRPTGGANYESRVLTTDESGNIFGTIASDVVGARGVDYWVSVTTRSRTLSDPATQPAAQPRTIRILVPDLEEPSPRPGGRYRMVSVPLDFGSDFTGDLEALLADQPAFGRYDPLKWRCFRWEGDYAELGDDGEEERFRVTPGKAFWLVAQIDNAIKTHPVAGTSTRADRPYDVTLQPGWNQIGNPFAFAVAWDSCRVDTLPMAEAESTVVEPAIRWQLGKGYRFDVKRLEPFEGYWVRNLSATAVTLKIPPQEAPAPSASEMPDAVESGQSSSTNDWRLEIRAASLGVEDAFNFVGVTPSAVREWDLNDRSKPPMSPGRALSLYFPRGGWQHPGAYRTDIRGDYERPDAESWGHTWQFGVAKTFSDERVGDEVTLTFAAISKIPAEVTLILVDRQQQRVLDLRESSSYTFFLDKCAVVTNEDDARFLLLAGSKVFVASHADEIPKLPETTVLHQNHPNPFNPTTLIRYDLATPGDVDLRVYDARGALVRVLEDGHRPAGRHEVGWNGQNERGEMVASGVYFYRLSAGTFVQTRKMVLLK